MVQARLNQAYMAHAMMIHENMARIGTKANRIPRLITLLIALLGCAVVAVPMLFSLAEPVPITLVGCGVTTFALAVFLFFSV